MSLLGIDVGTTGCKAAIYEQEGKLLASTYNEYDIDRPAENQAQLDAFAIWSLVKKTIAKALEKAKENGDDPVTSLAVSSLGEAVVPVSKEREILAPSMLNSDQRGAEYLNDLERKLSNEKLYRINGNVLGNHYTLTKLLWFRDKQPALYEKTCKFLPWSSFIAFMLGAEPAVDYSLANRTLLFDLETEDWSNELIEMNGLQQEKLPRTVPAATCIGQVDPSIARELGLPAGVSIVTGAHDQCANAVGCGVIQAGKAMFGMGTVICIVPVFAKRPAPELMIPRGLSTEHHAVPDKFVSFIYNQGGNLVKWFRNTFAAAEYREAKAAGSDIYAKLFAELKDKPTSVQVLPHFEPTGPPEFINNSHGLITGLTLGTTRGQILKAILEGAVYYLKENIDNLPVSNTEISEYISVGGGSKSDKWVKIAADIMGQPFKRPLITEAGTIGAAILAGLGNNTFSNIEEAASVMVKEDCIFEPDPKMHKLYTENYQQYKKLWPMLKNMN